MDGWFRTHIMVLSLALGGGGRLSTIVLEPLVFPLE